MPTPSHNVLLLHLQCFLYHCSWLVYPLWALETITLFIRARKQQLKIELD